MWIILVLAIVVMIAVISYINAPKCPLCNSTDIKDGYYSRGWNWLCSQASGDRGIFCNNCHKVSFEHSDERFLKTLPEWCDHPKRPCKPVYVWFMHHEERPDENSTHFEALEEQVYDYVMHPYTSVVDKADAISDLYERVYNQSGDRVHPADDVVSVFLQNWDDRHPA